MTMIDTYVESSALLRAVLDGDTNLDLRLTRTPRQITSRLTWYEADRAIRRSLHSGRISGMDG
jgi:hypothetical protein